MDRCVSVYKCSCSSIFVHIFFQIQASRKYIRYHQERFGYAKPNTEFVHGYMEKLSDAGIQDGAMDVVVCVT